MKKAITRITESKTYALSLFLLYMLFIIVNLAFTQESDKSGEKVKYNSQKRAEITKERLNNLVKGKAELGQPGQNWTSSRSDTGIIDPMKPTAPSPFLLDSLTNQKYLEALREYYDYHVSGLQHRRQVFKWQLFSAKLIFVIVLVLVFAGIYFAAVQFHSSLSQKINDKASSSEERTEFVASLRGIKVSSPVLGVIILVISLAFFYCYLVYVYPIEDIF